MIKRRSVRIKVLQAIYGFEHCESQHLDNFQKQLRARILSVEDIFLYNLLIIRKIGEAVIQEADMRASKLLKTIEDSSFNTKFAGNTLIKYLLADDSFNKLIEKKKLQYQLDDILIKKWYKDFKATETYQNYVRSPKNFDLKEDREIIIYLCKSFLFEQEDFHDHIQDHFNNWIDDAHYVLQNLTSTINNSKSSLSLVSEKNSYKAKLDDLVSFGSELLALTVHHKVGHMDLISSKLNNWDVDRLSATDVFIIRLALTELMYFPSIPPKVTINEYIDIAKEYSTPKSKDFINGILDNLNKELTGKGLIVKEGRGLM